MNLNMKSSRRRLVSSKLNVQLHPDKDKSSKYTDKAHSLLASPRDSDILKEEDSIDVFLKLFTNGTREYRESTLISIIRACDPYDMQFLKACIPRFHRNFLTLLDKEIVYRILQYIHPKFFITIAEVCRDWNQLMVAEDTWYALYKSIGLESLASVVFIKNGTAKENARRFYSYGNWAHGIFTSREFQAHSLGILCMDYDGKFIVTGSSDRNCKMFNINGICLRTYTGHDDAVSAVKFDSEKIVSG